MKPDDVLALGLIDTIQIAGRYLAECDLSNPNLQSAIKSLRKDDNLHRLMDIGELIDAKAYIQEQKNVIKHLCDVIELFKKMKEI